MFTTLLIGVIVVETILLFGQAHSIKLNHEEIDNLNRLLDAYRDLGVRQPSSLTFD